MRLTSTPRRAAVSRLKATAARALPVSVRFRRKRYPPMIRMEAMMMKSSSTTIPTPATRITSTTFPPTSEGNDWEAFPQNAADHERREEDRDPGLDEREAEEGPEHEEVALAEVERQGRPVGDIEALGDEGINAPHRHPAHQDLNEGLGAHLLLQPDDLAFLPDPQENILLVHALVVVLGVRLLRDAGGGGGGGVGPLEGVPDLVRVGPGHVEGLGPEVRRVVAEGG